jgi:ankyrin repeat protein
VSLGADPNVRGELGLTPLHIAALMGRSAVIQLLLESGADPNLAAHSGRTALDLAERAGHGHTEAAKLLRAHGLNQ